MPYILIYLAGVVLLGIMVPVAISAVLFITDTSLHMATLTAAILRMVSGVLQEMVQEISE